MIKPKNSWVHTGQVGQSSCNSLPLSGRSGKVNGSCRGDYKLSPYLDQGRRSVDWSLLIQDEMLGCLVKKILSYLQTWGWSPSSCPMQAWLKWSELVCSRPDQLLAVRGPGSDLFCSSGLSGAFIKPVTWFHLCCSTPPPPQSLVSPAPGKSWVELWLIYRPAQSLIRVGAPWKDYRNSPLHYFGWEAGPLREGGFLPRICLGLRSSRGRRLSPSSLRLPPFVAVAPSLLSLSSRRLCSLPIKARWAARPAGVLPPPPIARPFRAELRPETFRPSAPPSLRGGGADGYATIPEDPSIRRGEKGPRDGGRGRAEGRGDWGSPQGWDVERQTAREEEAEQGWTEEGEKRNGKGSAGAREVGTGWRTEGKGWGRDGRTEKGRKEGRKG